MWMGRMRKVSWVERCWVITRHTRRSETGRGAGVVETLRANVHTSAEVQALSLVEAPESACPDRNPPQRPERPSRQGTKDRFQ